MGPLLFAFSYFTNFPLPGGQNRDEGTAAASLAWLPLTGLALGLSLATLGFVFAGTGFPQYMPMKALLITALELWLGGARFINGYSHTCDGLFSRLGMVRSLEKICESHITSHGAIGLALYVAAKLFILAELSYQSGFIYLLLFFPCWTRWAVSFAMLRYHAAKEEGMAFFFKTGQKPVYIILSSVFTLLVLALMPRYFYLAALASFAAVLFCCSQIQLRFGGQTEETYGLVAITAELSFLLFTAISGWIFMNI